MKENKDIVFFILVCVIKTAYGFHGENFTDTESVFESETCYCNAGESLLIFEEKGIGICRCKCINNTSELTCSPCTDDLQYCSLDCCILNEQSCNADGFCRPPGELDFVTAAKVAVLFALIVTCIAVLVALFRAFFLPRWCNGRVGSAQTRSQPQRSSLNSVQRFVMDRMRSRPPDYEHQPEKPPSYEDCISSEEPPAYRVAVINEIGDPPPYNAVYIDNPVFEGADNLSVQELNGSAIILDVRTLPQVVPIHQHPNNQGAGYRNHAFAADESRNQNNGPSSNST